MIRGDEKQAVQLPSKLEKRSCFNSLILKQILLFRAQHYSISIFHGSCRALCVFLSVYKIFLIEHLSQCTEVLLKIGHFVISRERRRCLVIHLSVDRSYTHCGR